MPNYSILKDLVKSKQKNILLPEQSKVVLLTPTVVKDSILAIGVTKVYHHGFDN